MRSLFSPEEQTRLEALQLLSILDTPPEAEYGSIVNLAASITGCGRSWLTFIDADREWVKAAVGVSLFANPRPRSLSERVLKAGDPIDLHYPSVMPSPTGGPIARYVGVPVWFDNELVGSLAVMNDEPLEIRSDQIKNLGLLSEFVTHVLRARRLAIVNQEVIETLSNSVGRLQTEHVGLRIQGLELSVDNARLARLAETDGLTMVRNRRAFDEAMLMAFETEVPIALAMFDVDNFKVFNDTYGHLAGDVVLSRVAQILAAGVRDGDSVSRYGGEEFAVTLRGKDRMLALDVADRLRKSIESEPWPLAPVTISCGLSVRLPDDTVQSLIRHADSALYAAKRTGKNRVLAWRD